MNQKVPYLTRQIAYAFLVGLIAGGITMGLFDSYAKTPLFSSASMGGDGTFYCNEDPNNPCVSSGGGGGSNNNGGSVTANSIIDSTGRGYPGGNISNGGDGR